MHSQVLQAYQAERDALLERIRQVLDADGRVRAAWLWGSFGRGEADALSDLDVWVVVEDETLEAIAAGRQDYAAQVGVPLVVVEAPQNAPEKGAYLLALYPGRVAPHQVDWYWQAQSAARVPGQVQLLVDSAALPRSQAAPSFPGTPGLPLSRHEQVAHAVHFFWAMLLIVAKYLARSPAGKDLELLDLVHDPLAEVQAFVQPGEAVPARREPKIGSTPKDRLAHLRHLAATMEALMPAVAAAGADVPRAEIVSQARGYLVLVEDVVLSPFRRRRRRTRILAAP